MVGDIVNGKLIVRLIDAALSGKIEQVKIIANLLSSEMRSHDLESSKQISKMVGGTLRTAPVRVNPHPPREQNTNPFILAASSQKDLVNELILSDENRHKITQVIKEHKNKKKLLEHNLEPAKTLLFKGPPGVGKTLTAKWLSKEMDLPLRIVDLASVMSSLLGKTGNNLKDVFQEAASSPCILLLDEFDSLGKKRDDERDIGELKRLVTVLLQSIDMWPSTSILIAATNHAELLDQAIWRRFEIKLDFEMPNDVQIKNFLYELTNNDDVVNLHFMFKGMSYSDIKNEINKSQKAVILDKSDISYQIVTNYLNNWSAESLTLQDKKNIAVHLVSAKVSQRKVSELLNISRPTIKKRLLNKEII